ncbi:MAG TPA: alpha-L-rhamnosidase C-terminal domain-containing protein, partial [Terriglobia bacterium]|nr:alpha-L-rhamnosidase C-terminal domain-containing protein [Terriglobia bacterium]
HFVIHTSGDNRYQLFVNDARVLLGPAKGDLFHWRYETLDIAPHLRAGKNILAAVVWNFAGQAPMAQMSNQTGFLLQGDGSEESAVDTNSTWKVLRSSAFQMVPVGGQTHHAYTVVGPGERIDGPHYPWGWRKANYDDSKWQPARELRRAGPRGIQDSPSRWMLIPRAIPLMQATLQRLVHVRRYEGPSGFHPTDAFLQGGSPLSIPARSHVTLLLDQTFETTAYPELLTSGGRGSVVTLTYAEALFDKHHQKGNRNDIAGKTIEGYTDQFLPDGGKNRLFRPLWWRTYRYLEIDVRTGSAPLVLDDFRGEFTAYPFTLRARFESDDPTLEKMWRTGWRTARLCAHETYMDCPYYEQLQYAGDTRIQALISLYMTGDDRLVKNAIECLDHSRMAEGLTQSRYPSHLPQVIPPFSLFWIGMMHDLWWYHGDTDFLRQFLPNARDVLGWFEARLTPSGLLGKLPWWDFVDWTKDFPDGVPPQEADGQSAILSLQFAAALREAAQMESAFGSAARAAHDRALAARISQAVYKTCWDSARGLLADTPARRHFSQHASLLGVLTGAIPTSAQKQVMEKVLSDSTLTQCSYYFRFYLFKAMKKAGLGDEYISQLGPWRQMLSLGLTTWAETPEPTRSDCHAWSAHPNFDLLATVAGIEPAAPGFSKVAIQPHLGSLHELKASMPVPQGEIEVAYERQGEHLTAEVTLPAGLSGWFDWQGQRHALHSGAQRLVF